MKLSVNFTLEGDRSHHSKGDNYIFKLRGLCIKNSYHYSYL